MTETTEIVLAGNNVRNEIANLAKGQNAIFSTITGNNFESKVAVLNALSNSAPAADNLNKTIQLANVVIEAVDMADETTGEIVTQPRIVLIDADGTAYHAISGPAYRDVNRILALVGPPAGSETSEPWPAPLPIHVLREGQGTR